ncbi:hypothetical protein G7Z17_g9996 [Cylindrodendrum hubeiense]|uniref:Zn(2)-C6 fungal-type domain-containing protein n=1 Tax=Cylindrodendrum hubeiense TaxID=595255 RepID=A0A9P5LD43_9HYPO|nr:hypothetical protein G7Z17_g9996 [Cylindrodendrum hubeiense]
MAETVIRKACDRCHAQKLSCKRYNDESCERCLRLKTECKSSPSLRYRKQQQQQQQQQQHQRHQLPVSESASSVCRSPKRRRTDSDSSLVSPDAAPVVPHTSGVESKSHLTIAPDPPLEIGDFNFTFDQLGLFAPSHPEYLSQPGLPGGVDQLNLHHQPLPPLSIPLPSSGAFSESPWDPRPTSSADSYPPVVPGPLLPPANGPLPHQPVAHQGLLKRGGCVPAHDSPDKRPRPRTRQRPRQIQLSDRPGAVPLYTREPPSIHWMAQLSDINARLLDLSSALPSSQETARNGPSLGRPTDERFKGSGFPIDDMFQLTRRVADILEQPPASETIDSSDPGNSMFILSTYTRLLDMYQKVFALVQSELSHTGSNAGFRFWKLPDVTVGSFAVESSPFLQMSLTIQVAEGFLSRLRKSTARWSRAGGGSASMFTGVVDLSFQAFRDQELGLAKHLVELRCEVEALLDA